MRPPAIGYLRRDISGVHKAWHQIQIRTLAERFGYDLVKTIEFSEFTADPIAGLIGAVRHDKAEAVVTHSADHLGGEIPDELVRVADVITVVPEETHARELLKPL